MSALRSPRASLASVNVSNTGTQEAWPTTTVDAGVVSEEGQLKSLLKDGVQFLRSQVEVWKFRTRLEEQEFTIGQALIRVQELENKILKNTPDEVTGMVTRLRQIEVDFNGNLSTYHDKLIQLSSRMASLEGSVRNIACQLEKMFSKAMLLSTLEEKEGKSVGSFLPWYDAAQLSSDALQEKQWNGHNKLQQPHLQQHQQKQQQQKQQQQQQQQLQKKMRQHQQPSQHNQLQEQQQQQEQQQPQQQQQHQQQHQQHRQPLQPQQQWTPRTPRTPRTPIRSMPLCTAVTGAPTASCIRSSSAPVTDRGRTEQTRIFAGSCSVVVQPRRCHSQAPSVVVAVAAAAAASAPAATAATGVCVRHAASQIESLTATSLHAPIVSSPSVVSGPSTMGLVSPLRRGDPPLRFSSGPARGSFQASSVVHQASIPTPPIIPSPRNSLRGRGGLTSSSLNEILNPPGTNLCRRVDLEEHSSSTTLQGMTRKQV